MEFELSKFVADDVNEMSIQTMQAADSTRWNNELATKVQKSGPCFTGRFNGKVIGCAGLWRQWHGRAFAWLLLDKCVSARKLLWITRQIILLLDENQQLPEFRRIETTVDDGFVAGHRWVRMLGFESEGVLRSYDPFGKDARMYARIV